MNALANYGSDDEYDDSSEEKKTVNIFLLCLRQKMGTHKE